MPPSSTDAVLFLAGLSALSLSTEAWLTDCDCCRRLPLRFILGNTLPEEREADVIEKGAPVEAHTVPYRLTLLQKHQDLAWKQEGKGGVRGSHTQASKAWGGGGSRSTGIMIYWKGMSKETLVIYSRNLPKQYQGICSTMSTGVTMSTASISKVLVYTLVFYGTTECKEANTAIRGQGRHCHSPLPLWDQRGGSSCPCGSNPFSRQDRNERRCPPLGKWMGGRWTPSWPTSTIVPPLSAVNQR